MHHDLRSVVRKIEGDYGNETNLNTRATAIMSNLQERALAEANAKAEVRRMQQRLTLVEVERNVLEKRLLEFDTQFVQMRARAAVAENAVAFQLQPSPRHQVLMRNAADIVRGSVERVGAVNERGQLALPSTIAQVMEGEVAVQTGRRVSRLLQKSAAEAGATSARGSKSSLSGSWLPMARVAVLILHVSLGCSESSTQSYPKGEGRRGSISVNLTCHHALCHTRSFEPRVWGQKNGGSLRSVEEGKNM